jgi:hypothetical protein
MPPLTSLTPVVCIAGSTRLPRVSLVPLIRSTPALRGRTIFVRMFVSESRGLPRPHVVMLDRTSSYLQNFLPVKHPLHVFLACIVQCRSWHSCDLRSQYQSHRWLSKHCRSLVVHVGWPRWHCPYLVRFLCGFSLRWTSSLISSSLLVCIVPMATMALSVMVVDGRNGTVNSRIMLLWTSNLISWLICFNSMLRPSAVG